MAFVDDCPHTFEQLARFVLPDHFARLQQALAGPHPAALFAQDGNGPASLARRLGVRRAFSGCYVLLENDRPIYVGISRDVLARIREHLRGTTHNQASLVYSIAQRRRPTPGCRDAAMEHEDFKVVFSLAQADLRSSRVAFIAIENALELYLFEVYAAMALGTHELNTFRTH